MAIIYSYPQYAPKPEDLLIGTVTLDENAAVPIYDNPTVSFTIQSLLDMIAPVTGAQNLQQVTNIGATTSNTVTFTSDVKVTGRFYDSSGSPGSAGQVLSSTVTGTSWIVNSPASVTSVGLSMPAAFSVANSPITTAGVLAVTGAGSALQYINGLGALVTFPTIPTQYVLPLAADGTRGGIQIGYAENAKNYPVELSNEKAFVNVPWTDTPYTLPVATNTDLGGVKIGYTDNAKNYAVELDSDQMYVNVPWTDTIYTLPLAADGTRGGVQIGYTEAGKNYPVELDTEKMFVNVPWTDTQNPFQTITGAGSDNTDSGVILSDSGGTVLILGSGSVTAAQAGNTITLTGVNTWVANSLNVAGYVAAPGAVASKVWKTDASGNPAWRDDANTDTGITGVTLAVNSTGTWTVPLSESISNRELTLTSNIYGGGSKVGFVPAAGTATTFLRGDGSWGAIPTGLQFKGTWDASGTGGGNPDLTTLTPSDGWLYIVNVAGSAAPNGSGVAPNSWNLGDWCIYDGSAWTRVPATNAGVTSVTTTDGTYVDLTPNTATTGAITVTADLSAVNGTSDTNTRFLSKDNTWDVPSYTGAGVTTFTNTNGTFISAGTENATATGAVTVGTIDLSATGLSGTPATAATQFLSGANTWSVPPGTYTLPLAADGTRGGVQIGYTTDAANRNYAITLDSEKMLVNVPWTNTQNTYTAGTGLGLSSFEFSANVNATAQSTQPEAVSADSNRTYAVQVDDTNDKLVVNVPWSSGGTYSWKVRDNASTPVNKTLSSGEFLQFKTATGALATGLAGTGTTTDPYVMTLTSPNTTYSNFTAASASAAGVSGLVVAPPAGAQGKFLRGDASWVSETTYSTFTGADGTNAGTSGLVPAPAAADNVKFLKGDGTWAPTPQGDITEIKTTAPITGAATSGIATIAISNMGAATASAAGTKGAVPASVAGDQAKFLRADATWVVPTNTLYALAGAASSTAGEYNLVLSADGTAQDTMVFKEGSNVTFTRAADSLTIAAANDNDNTTYSIDVPAATTNINLKGANPSSNDAIALTPSTGISITRNSDSQLTFANTSPDTGVPAILSNGSAPSLNTGITSAEVRTLIDAQKVGEQGYNTIIVTVVAVSGVGNRYQLDGYTQINAQIKPGFTYRFDQSDSSNSSHPLAFKDYAGNAYTTGVTTVGTPGSAGAYTQIIPTQQTNNLTYYCTNHAGMGGTVTTGTGEVFVDWTNVANPGKLTLKSNTESTLQLRSEDVALAANEIIGAIEFYGSDGTAPGAGVKSSILARNGDQVGGTGDKSNLIFAVSDGASNNNEALRINSTGSIAIDGATKYGTSGQVLTSAGDAPPTWTTPGTGPNYYLDGITKAGNVLTFSVSGTTNQTYTFGANAFNSTTIPTNNNQITNGAGYITSYTETDTLATVTGRGATTATACSFTNTTSFTVGSSGTGSVYIGNNATGKFARFHTNNTDTYYDMNCGNVLWRQSTNTRFKFDMTSSVFTCAGDIVAYGSPSDKRLKENIKPIESALDKVIKLQGVTFDWKKSDSELNIKEDIGFIAQDVQKVVPELVRENENGMLSMRHQGIAPILLEAIKELKIEIEELKKHKCNCNK